MAKRTRSPNGSVPRYFDADHKTSYQKLAAELAKVKEANVRGGNSEVRLMDKLTAAQTALSGIRACLSPGAAGHCEGCDAEMNHALELADAALLIISAQ